MKVVSFLVALVIFLAGFWLFGVAFSVPEEWRVLTFFGGILAVALGVGISIHVLPSATDSKPDAAFRS